MISKIYKLLSILLVVALALYIVLLNKEAATLYLGPQVKISATAGVVYIAIFVLGILFAALVAVWFGVKAYIRERRLINRDRQRNEFYQGMLRARSFKASHEWAKAAEEWQTLLRKDPTDMIARVELSRCLESTGEKLEALKVLEQARQSNPKNTEVLFRAAELNLALDNKTSAIDNLVLILHSHPNRRAASMARDLSEELERYSDALEYESRLAGFSANSDQESTRQRLEFKKLLFEARANPLGLETALRAFVKRNTDFAPALKKLAELEEQAGNIEAAAQSLVKAAKAGSNPDYWLDAARLWVKHSQPERAVAALRAAQRDTSGLTRIESELDAIRLYILLNMQEQARRAIEGFTALAHEQGVALTKEISHEFLILKGLYHNCAREYDKSHEIWQQLCENDFEVRSSLSRPVLKNGSAPSPSLSTP